MDEPMLLGVGLHVCTSVSRNPEGNLEGVECDQSSYSSMDVLYACVIGRAPEVGERLIKFYLNGSIVEKVSGGADYHIIYSYPLDERFLGAFRIEYIENGCTYWAKSFSMGTCPVALPKPAVSVATLVSLLRKFRV